MVKVNFNPVPNYLDEAVAFRVESESRPGTYHYVFKLRHGGVLCTCEGWQFRGYCKHVQVVPLDAEAPQRVMRRWRHEDQDFPQQG